MDDEVFFQQSGFEHLCIVDVCQSGVYEKLHLPDAIWLNRQLLVSIGPYPGLIPPKEQLEALLAPILSCPKNTLFVVYDDEFGKVASRLLWILDCLGYKQWALLDGGINGWLHHKYPLSKVPSTQLPSSDIPQVFPDLNEHNIFANELMSLISQEVMQADERIILDVRSLPEYTGEKMLAQHRGHITGAIHYEWCNLIDMDNKGLLKPKEELIKELCALGLEPNKEIITYCQTHMRASLVYVVLRYLGFNKIRGYGGSWGEWGNLEDASVSCAPNTK